MRMRAAARASSKSGRQFLVVASDDPPLSRGLSISRECRGIRPSHLVRRSSIHTFRRVVGRVSSSRPTPSPDTVWCVRYYVSTLRTFFHRGCLLVLCCWERCQLSHDLRLQKLEERTSANRDTVSATKCDEATSRARPFMTTTRLKLVENNE